MHNEQKRTDEASPTAAQGNAAVRFLLVLVGVFLLSMAGVGASYLLLHALPTNGFALECPNDPPTAKSDEPPKKTSKPVQFAGWDKPDLVIVVSGQMHGYLMPCGCSDPQNGGLVRRMTFIDELKQAGWPVVGVDLGELAATTGIRRQRELKLQYTMKSLDLMGYRAVGLGKHEMAMPLIDALAQHSLNHANPRPLAATLAETEKKGEKYHDMNVRPYEVFGVGKTDAPPRVGVFSMTGPALEDSFKGDKLMKFRNNKAVVLPKIFEAFANEKVDLAILLHHEYPEVKDNDPLTKVDDDRHAMAEVCARAWETARQNAAENSKPAIPPLQLMMILDEEPEPPGFMHHVKGTPTHIIKIGHKGKYAGVVGIFNKGGQITLKYELVLMDPSFAPKEGQKNPVLDALEEYTRQVHKEDLLSKFIRSDHPLQVDTYVQKLGGTHFAGSEACKACHKKELKIWAATRHAGAYDTLVQKATKPSLRQYDPECVVCHTVGFKNSEGFNDLAHAAMRELLKNKAGQADIDAQLKQHNARLMGVGCESCHGPASVHIQNQFDTKLYALINPFRPSEAEERAAAQMNAKNPQDAKQAAVNARNLFDKRMDRLDDFCQKCHDSENDVHWKHVLPRWVGGRIVHNSKANVGNQWLPPRSTVQPGNGNKKD